VLAVRWNEPIDDDERVAGCEPVDERAEELERRIVEHLPTPISGTE
jgi:hypothetical protein